MNEPADPDRYAPELGDWRLHNTGWITALNGIPLEVPMAHHMKSVYEPGGGRNRFSFTTPSAAALHLNSAWKAARRAKALKDRMHLDVHSDGLAGYYLSVPEKETPELFDYFEEMMVTAMCCGNAIDAFCNHTIIEKAQGPILARWGKYKKRPVELPADEVERWAPIDDKVKRLVPDLLGIKTPCNKPAWDAYQRIKDMRDRVTHFKRSDQARPFDTRSKPTALLELWLQDCYAPPEDAMTVLRYFQPENAEARWMRNPLWKRPDEEPDANHGAISDPG